MTSAIKVVNVFMLAACLVFVFGCQTKKEVLGALDSRQSIEVFVALSRENIAAEREKVSSGRKEKYRVSVNNRDYPRALEILHEYGLPKKGVFELESVMQSKGFTPDSTEMSGFRLDYALGLQVERLLSSLPGVVDARVLIRSNLAPVSKRHSTQKTSSASVVIRYVSGSKRLPFSTDEVRKVIAQAVPGLDVRSIQLSLSSVMVAGGSHFLLGESGTSGQGNVASQLNPLLRFRVHEQDKFRALKQIFAYLVVFCVAGIAIGFRWGSLMTRRGLLKKGRKKSASPRAKNFFLEASLEGEAGGTGKFSRGKGSSDSTPGTE